MRGARVLAAVSLCALAGCTAANVPQGVGSPRGQAPSSAPQDGSGQALPPPGPNAGPLPPPGPNAGPLPPGGPPGSRGAGATVPLVLAVHATRHVADVPVEVARSVVRRVATDPDLTVRWAAIEQPGGGRATVRAATAAEAADRLLERVSRSDDLLAVVPATAVDASVRVLTVGGIHPLREPRQYPLETRSEEGPAEVTTLTVVGDVMLGRRVAAASAGDPIRALRPTARRLAAAEITIGNLESTLSDNGTPRQGGDSFHADPSIVKGLRLAGFDAVSLANNHVGDYGPRALRETLAELRDAGLPYVGAGRDLAEARRAVVLTRDGVRVAFIGVDSIGETPAASAASTGTNRLNMPPRTGPLNQRQLDRIARDIERVAKEVDVVVVIPHWGTQYTHAPEASQRRAARAFAAAGADVVIGSHPHWVQGWEQIGSAVVVHSLGNFIFDMDFQTKTMEGVFVEVALWGDEVKAVEPVPYVLDRRFVPRVVTGGKAGDILEDVWSTSRGPFAQP